MKQKVYIETSVVSYLAADPAGSFIAARQRLPPNSGPLPSSVLTGLFPRWYQEAGRGDQNKPASG
jgi:hypothetical protein